MSKKKGSLDALFAGHKTDKDMDGFAANSSFSTRFPFTFKLEDGESSRVMFLNEAQKTQLMLYSVQARTPGGIRWETLLQKQPVCPLQKIGLKASPKQVYMLLDIDHSYEDKTTGDIVSRPQIKVFYAAKKSSKLIDRALNKQGSLVGKIWEIERLGSGTDTQYDISDPKNPGKGHTLDDYLDAMVDYKNKKGEDVTVSWIMQPSWPEYLTDISEINQSEYTRNKLKPDIDMDWKDPDLVDAWVIAYFQNRPDKIYHDIVSMHEDEVEDDDGSHTPEKESARMKEKLDRNKKAPPAPPPKNSAAKKAAKKSKR